MANDCVCGETHAVSEYGVRCPVLQRASELLGHGARIGRNFQYNDAPLFVGKYEHGEWKMFGAGNTWDEAFANLKKVVYQRGNGRFVFEGEEKKKS